MTGKAPSALFACPTQPIPAPNRRAVGASLRQLPECPTQHRGWPQAPIPRERPQIGLKHRIGPAGELLELAGGAAAEVLDRLERIRGLVASGLSSRGERCLAVGLVGPPAPDPVLAAVLAA